MSSLLDALVVDCIRSKTSVERAFLLMVASSISLIDVNTCARSFPSDKRTVNKPLDCPMISMLGGLRPPVLTGATGVDPSAPEVGIGSMGIGSMVDCCCCPLVTPCLVLVAAVDRTSVC